MASFPVLRSRIYSFVQMILEMQQLIATGSLVLGIVLISIALRVVAARQQKKRNKCLIKTFEQAAKERSLKPGPVEYFKDRVWGMDVKKRILLFTKAEGDDFISMVVDLNTVESCHLRKVYEKKIVLPLDKKITYMVSEIVLDFRLSDESTRTLPFYQFTSDAYPETTDPELIALKWEEFIYKLLQTGRASGKESSGNRI